MFPACGFATCRNVCLSAVHDVLRFYRLHIHPSGTWNITLIYLLTLHQLHTVYNSQRDNGCKLRIGNAKSEIGHGYFNLRNRLLVALQENCEDTRPGLEGSERESKVKLCGVLLTLPVPVAARSKAWV
jgi:hypothetical protein